MGIGSRLVHFATAAAMTAGGWSASVDAGLPAGTRATRAARSTGQRSQMIDIALDSDRNLRGQFVDSAGQPIDGALVALHQNEQVIARSTTLADGTFLIERVPAGSYRLSCGSASGPVRCWTPEAAPPNAVTDGVTFQDNVVRGQAVAAVPALFGTTALTTAAASGSVIGGVAVYAAAEGGPRSGAAAIPAPEPPLPPTSTAHEFSGQVVGRDEHGNLVRLGGPAPWAPKSPLPSPPTTNGPPTIILPPEWPRPQFADDRRPASP